MVKETLPGTAWRDAHQLPLTEQPGQPGLAVGSTAEVGGEHLQQGQPLEAAVHHGPHPPARVEVEPGHEAEVVQRDGAVVPDYQTPALHWDVVQAQDGVAVPQPQVGIPQSSGLSGDLLSV